MDLFPPWANSVTSAVLILALMLIVGLPLGAWLYVRSPLNTGVGEPVSQPVVFDHRHHAGDDGIDCRYCHYTVERAPYAGVPPAAVCMGCHAQLWTAAPLLEPVRAAYFSGEALVWKRVHSLPDYVFFNHAVHVSRGVGCESCHGRVDLEAAVQKTQPMTMEWCLSCHRDPEPHLRPPEHAADMGWQASEPRLVGAAVKQALGVQPTTTCSGCHR